ncbi:MAG: serine/threonine protein kinase, partial [Myxococcales bacterium]|nr:serine/threonine protein kinase [Myxococcales bacterium]
MRAERLGKYQLVSHLASGGMASVYLARVSGPGGFQRHVVLKTLRTRHLADDTLVPMFLDEARLVAAL